jgi:hypothetical protein
MLGGPIADDAAHSGGAGEVDALDGRCINQGTHHLARIGWRVGDEGHQSGRQASIHKGLDDQGMGARALL